MKAKKKQPSGPTLWFAILEQAISDRDGEMARMALVRLQELGFDVNVDLRTRPPIAPPEVLA